MEFVVGVLTTHLGLANREATIKMLEIHNKGGALIALSSADEAQSIADAISTEARAAGHSFLCRYASAGALSPTVTVPQERAT
jgi:ATP-dependent Clp protease adapter protein ClpS